MDSTAVPTKAEYLAVKGCLVCLNLKRMLTGDHFGNDLNVTTCVKASPCSIHDPIFKKIMKGYDDLSWGPFEANVVEGPQQSQNDVSCGRERKPKPEQIWFRRYSGYLFSTLGISYRHATGGGVRSWPLLLSESATNPEVSANGRFVGPWVDLDRVKQWQADCVQSHGIKCSNPFRIRSVSPAWLIDTATDCLTSGTGISEYIALSYTWGNTSTFRVTFQALERLQEPGALSSDRLTTLPPTIRHAMKLSLALGERYLWVDAICIVQDDEAHLAEQLRLMGAIYASAKLTIVAADGDACHGLPGLRGISPPRDLNQDIFETGFGDQKIIFRRTLSLLSKSDPADYFARGWTFQEYYLSKRRLIFQKNQVYWQCGCSRWSEDLIPPEKQENKEMLDLPYQFSGIITGMPNHYLLNDLLRQYNSRTFRYAEDTMPGILGLLAVFCRAFEGSFLYGLPEAWFDCAIAWQPDRFGNAVRRSVSEQKHIWTSANPLPSWSWVSWTGNCFNTQAEREETFELDDEGNTTFPIAQWYAHETPEPTVKRPIISRWSHLRRELAGSTVKLAQGWTREIYDAAKHGPPYCDRKDENPQGHLGQFVYRHSALPKKSFWLPIPLSAVDKDVDACIGPQEPYISCNTRRGWFAVSKYPPLSSISGWVQSKQRDFLKFHLRLLSSNGDVCGDLRLHNEADMSKFPDLGGEGHYAKLELVAVSRTKARIHPPYRDEEGDIRKTYWEPRVANDKVGLHKYHEVYNVLWVEWNGGVAYRKAAGFVHKHFWEAHETSEVNLVLG